MKRQTLDNGQWFDIDGAKSWEEGSRWDGHNHVSLATSDKFAHEKLYRTRGGKWIVNHWSQWQGSRDSWIEINGADAARWLSCNEHGPAQECATEFAALEVP